MVILYKHSLNMFKKLLTNLSKFYKEFKIIIFLSAPTILWAIQRKETENNSRSF